MVKQAEVQTEGGVGQNQEFDGRQLSA